MKHTKKVKEKTISKKAKIKAKPKSKKPAAEKIKDVQRLVHLLQVHQIELEHQNQNLELRRKSWKCREINM